MDDLEQHIAEVFGSAWQILDRRNLASDLAVFKIVKRTGRPRGRLPAKCKRGHELNNRTLIFPAKRADKRNARFVCRTCQLDWQRAHKADRNEQQRQRRGIRPCARCGGARDASRGRSKLCAKCHNPRHCKCMACQFPLPCNLG